MFRTASTNDGAASCQQRASPARLAGPVIALPRCSPRRPPCRLSFARPAHTLLDLSHHTHRQESKTGSRPSRQRRGWRWGADAHPLLLPPTTATGLHLPLVPPPLPHASPAPPTAVSPARQPSFHPGAAFAISTAFPCYSAVRVALSLSLSPPPTHARPHDIADGRRERVYGWSTRSTARPWSTR